MFNPLLDKLPTSVEIDSVEYKINCDFRSVLKVTAILEDEIFTLKERQVSALSWFYERVPNDPAKALEEMYAFINMYREPNNESNHEPYYDFDEDSGMIFSAFYQIYGIDLTEIKMHWFKFINLFENLNDGTPLFVKVVGYRSEDVDPNASASYKSHLNKMKKKYQLERNKRLLRRVMKRRKVGMFNE